MKKCPTCHRPVNWENNPDRPFCSERCKLLDFGAWADEEYGVPAEDSAPSLEELEGDTTATDGDSDLTSRTPRR
ncbi:MAG TPA: DNA gyrase inhibitor YacG [Pyrinomonadaceae bacterium]|nr:DNA gyrase inhibitor YacG [Pyrinomonadaceae bacterium]